MFLLLVCVVIGGVMAESSTCDESYKDSCNACAFYNFGCGIVGNAVFDIPTCFTGSAQSPIDLSLSSATITDDLGQLTFSGYNENVTWPGPPVLRLKDFTVQLDFNQVRQRKWRGKKKRLRKQGEKKRKRKRLRNQSTKRSRRDNVSPPSISGGALGDSVWVFFRLFRVWAHFCSCHHLGY